MPAGRSAPAAEPWGLPAWGGERGTRDSSVPRPGRSLGSNLQINFQNSPGRWNLGSAGLGDGATTLVHPPWRPGPGDTLAPGVTLTYISAVCHRGLLEFVALGILEGGGARGMVLQCARAGDDSLVTWLVKFTGPSGSFTPRTQRRGCSSLSGPHAVLSPFVFTGGCFYLLAVNF